MEKELFSPMAIDALGEMMNISLGSSATAVSNMLDHRVDITTPKVSVTQIDDFVLGNLEPAIGVEISYVEGLEGSNIMVLKKSDIRVIVDILMGTQTPDEEFELNDLTISAVCEVMNQMMGSAATALSDFLGFPVNISTPQTFELEDLQEFRDQHKDETLIIVHFFLRIEGEMESEFMNVMSVGLAKKLMASLGLEEEAAGIPDSGTASAPAPAPTPAPAPAPEASGGGGKSLSQEEIEKLLAGGGSDAAPAPAPAPEPSGGSGKQLSQEEIEKLMSGGAPSAAPAPAQPAAAQMPPQAVPGQMPPYAVPPGAEGAAFANGYMGYPPMYYPPYPYPYPPQQEQKQPDPKVINTQPLPMKEMDVAEKLGKEQAENLELIMEVPLQVTVEIGRTRRKVQDILEFAKGSLVVLDKLAGDQVDLFVNGKCIARGDVVVIDDNFGVRITEIVQTPAVEMLAKK